MKSKNKDLTMLLVAIIVGAIIYFISVVVTILNGF